LLVEPRFLARYLSIRWTQSPRNAEQAWDFFGLARPSAVSAVYGRNRQDNLCHRGWIRAVRRRQRFQKAAASFLDDCAIDRRDGKKRCCDTAVGRLAAPASAWRGRPKKSQAALHFEGRLRHRIERGRCQEARLDEPTHPPLGVSGEAPARIGRPWLGITSELELIVATFLGELLEDLAISEWPDSGCHCRMPRWNAATGSPFSSDTDIRRN